VSAGGDTTRPTRRACVALRGVHVRRHPAFRPAARSPSRAPDARRPRPRPHRSVLFGLSAPRLPRGWRTAPEGGEREAPSRLAGFAAPVSRSRGLHQCEVQSSLLSSLSVPASGPHVASPRKVHADRPAAARAPRCLTVHEPRPRGTRLSPTPSAAHGGSPTSVPTPCQRPLPPRSLPPRSHFCLERADPRVSVRRRMCPRGGVHLFLSHIIYIHYIIMEIKSPRGRRLPPPSPPAPPPTPTNRWREREREQRAERDGAASARDNAHPPPWRRPESSRRRSCPSRCPHPTGGPRR
jgi:hypothetical protein